MKVGKLALVVLAGLAFGVASFYGGGFVGRRLLRPSGLKSTVRLARNPPLVPLVAVRTLDGAMLSSADWRGKVTIVNFWATWCGPCREETPDFLALERHYPDHVRIIGLSVDEDAAAVRRWVAANGIDYPVAMAGPELQQRFGGIDAVPTSFVLDPDGRIVQEHVGLYPALVYDLEVRVLAGLPVDANVERVDDQGQVRLGDHVDLTEVPGVDLSGLTPAARAAVLKQLNTEICPCGCQLSLARCRRTEPGCDKSLPRAREIVEAARRRQD